MSDFDIDMNRVTMRSSSNIFKAFGEIDILLDNFLIMGARCFMMFSGWESR